MSGRHAVPSDRLKLVTNRHRRPQIESLLDLIARAAGAGVDLVQVRGTRLPPGRG